MAFDGVVISNIVKDMRERLTRWKDIQDISA